MKGFVKSQLTVFIFGLAFWLPLVVIIFILALLLMNAEELGRKFLLFFVPSSLVYPGFGVFMALLIIYISGMVLKTNRIRKTLSKIPLLGLLFSTGEIVTVDRLLHMEPCIFQIAPSCLSYGWILSDLEVSMGQEDNIFKLVNVYYPNVPTLVTGQVFPVRKETVIRLGNSSKEIIDLLLYAFRRPRNLRYLPWEDETQEEFAIRARSFGLNVSIPDVVQAVRKDCPW